MCFYSGVSPHINAFNQLLVKQLERKGGNQVKKNRVCGATSKSKRNKRDTTEADSGDIFDNQSIYKSHVGSKGRKGADWYDTEHAEGASKRGGYIQQQKTSPHYQGKGRRGEKYENLHDRNKYVYYMDL